MFWKDKMININDLKEKYNYMLCYQHDWAIQQQEEKERQFRKRKQDKEELKIILEQKKRAEIEFMKSL